MARVKLRNLKAEFPYVPFDFWSYLITKECIFSSELDEEKMQILRFVLSEENNKGKRASEAEKELIEERLGEIRNSMLHCLLGIESYIPPDIDLEHAQAYLVYGLLVPCQQRTFAASRKITIPVIRKFASNKLGRILFDQEKFRAVHAWFIKNGVVIMKGGGISLNTADKKCSDRGRAVINEAKKFLLGFSQHGKK